LSVYDVVNRIDFVLTTKLNVWGYWNRAYRIPVLAVSMLVLLNVADAWLTTQLLAHGGVEAVWWSSHFNSNMFLKGLLALLVALIFICIGRAYILKWLNIGMVFVVFSNLVCFLGYSVSWLYWQTQIATFP